MGAGASNPRAAPQEPTPADVAALEQPFLRDTGEACYYCLPFDDSIKRRSPLVVLEVGPLGFRLLRPDSEDCLFAYPWGQIHSWAHTDNRFSFRYFDDGKKKVVQYVLFLRDMGPLLGNIQSVIDAILLERKSLAIPQDRFTDLLRALEAVTSRGGSPVELLGPQHTGDFYFWSEQGRQLMDATPSSFDKVEVAVLVHGRLIDQNRFSYMLEGLESQEDRDNVWHRITLAKKLAAKAHPGGALTVAAAATVTRPGSSSFASSGSGSRSSTAKGTQQG